MRRRSREIPWLRALALSVSLLSVAGGCGPAPAPVDAKTLGLPAIARPAAATQGAARAYLAASSGALTITAANGAAIEASPGMPLLADDRLALAGGLAMIIFTSGNTLRLDGGVESELRGLAGFDSPPTTKSLEEQLSETLTPDERASLGLQGERLGGWQLRQTVLDAPAAEAAAPLTPEPEPPPEEPKDDAANLGGEVEKKAEEARPAAVVQGGLTGKTSGYGGAGSATPSSKDAKPASPKPGSRALLDEAPSDGDGAPARPADDPQRDADTTPKASSTPEVIHGWAATLAVIKGTSTAVTLPRTLRASIAACLRTVKSTKATVTIDVRGGKVRSLAVAGASLKCVDEFAGANAEGVPTGIITATFSRLD